MRKKHKGAPAEVAPGTVEVTWLSPALGHNVGDVTNEPAAWVETVGEPAELVRRGVVADEDRGADEDLATDAATVAEQESGGDPHPEISGKLPTD